jgi:hypothetical protein
MQTDLLQENDTPYNMAVEKNCQAEVGMGTQEPDTKEVVECKQGNKSFHSRTIHFL